MTPLVKYLNTICPFSFAEGEIHLWLIDIPKNLGLLSEFYQILSPNERLKANSLRLPHVRGKYVLTAVARRILLSGYLGINATELQIRLTAKGMPYLEYPSVNPLRFSISHTTALTAIAFARSQEIGVDLELIDYTLPARTMAESALTDKEMNLLAPLAKDQYVAAFYRLWVRKEAYLKAVGEGFSITPNLVDVSGLCGIVNGDPPEVTREQIYIKDLSLRIGYAAAIATERRDVTFQTFRFVSPAA